jgi:glycosyltransferase involved in cell wall biosynthesis
MNASVVISTWNRAASLARTLDSLVRLQPLPEEWELIVVDNNSSDDTKTVCLERDGVLPLRYMFDAVPGKWGALNRAIASARGQLLVFTDDDVDVEPGWLFALWDAATRHPEAAFFGGRVIPRWEVTPPRWLLERTNGDLRGLAVSCNLGSVERQSSAQDGAFLGANMAFRSSVFEHGWRFPERLGPRGDARYPGGETRLMSELRADGASAVWVPDAVVNHRNDASRATGAYLRKWHVAQGRSLVIDGTIEKVGPTWFGVPRYLLRQLAQSACAYASTRLLASASVWLPAEVQMARTSGAIREFWNRRHRAAGSA